MCIQLNEVAIVRPSHLAPQIVIVDGQFGCGKTMLSPIIAALERVELLTYAYTLEHLCALFAFGKMTEDAVVTMLRMLTDSQLYDIMMSRGVNFRWSDLSSVWKSGASLRYLRRLFQRGDEFIPLRIKEEKPILQLTTHNLLGIATPLFAALGDRVVLIEVVRHPLYMLKQQTVDMESLFNANARDFTIYFDYKGHTLPFFTRGWEERFLYAHPVEKAIYAMEKNSAIAMMAKKNLRSSHHARIITIPFERFVFDPLPYLAEIAGELQTRVTSMTRRAMRKQRVPRLKYAEGIPLPIYKRFGWEPPQSGASEADELKRRRDFAIAQASPEALRTLDRISRSYEEKYLS